MGRLEEELERIERELAALEASRTPAGREQRHARLKALVAALRGGRDTSGFDPGEVTRVEEAMIRYSPALDRVMERVRRKGGVIGEDGGVKFDE